MCEVTAFYILRQWGKDFCQQSGLQKRHKKLEPPGQFCVDDSVRPLKHLQAATTDKGYSEFVSFIWKLIIYVEMFHASTLYC